MKVLILMGSPRLKGNTAELCKPFMEELTRLGGQVTYLPLANMHIRPCKGCYACQEVDAPEYGCIQRDGMYALVEELRLCDIIVLATPIYSWYCPAEMKAVLDRHFGLNKLYRGGRGSLWAGKGLGVLATCGYEPDAGCGPFLQGVESLCRHSQLRYLGWYAVRDTDDLASFRTPEAMEGARAFARKLLTGG